MTTFPVGAIDKLSTSFSGFAARLLTIIKACLRAVFSLNPDYEHRVFGLDIMRALAIIFVVLEHSLMLEKANTGFPWIRLINGVELFFVLSGFLIGGILIKIYFRQDSFGVKPLVNFWVRRWFRTLPNYYLILILNIVVVYFGIIKEDFSQVSWKFFLFLQNFSGPFYGFFWESWSLSIEEWFYLIFPLLLLITYLLLAYLKCSRKTMFLTSIIILLVVPFLLRYFKASKIDVNDFSLGVRIYKVVIYRLDSIALGILAAFIKYQSPRFWHRIRNWTFIAGIVFSYILLYMACPPNLMFTKVFRMFLQSVGCFMLLPKFDSIKKGPRIFLKVFTHISLISYSMYLLNLALIAEIITSNFSPHGPRGAWAMTVVYWFSVIVLSTLLYKYYEKPMMDFRDKIKLKF